MNLKNSKESIDSITNQNNTSMMANTKSIFEINIEFLTHNLLPSGLTDPMMDGVIKQLRYIFNVTEESWNKRKNFIQNLEKKIEYLLICEAPPWTQTEPNYFYLNPNGQLFKTVWHTFFPDRPLVNPYNELANKGFLLIDSLPLSIKYETKHRKSSEYLQLIEINKQWWINKLDNSGLAFSENLKIALGYFWNGKRLIEACGGKITLKNNDYSLNCDLIISHRKSRYLPDYIKLREVFHI